MLSGSNTLENRNAIVSGWGSLKFGTSKFPKELHSVNVKVWNNPRCNSNYGSQAPGGITDRMLCASLPGKDSCQVEKIIHWIINIKSRYLLQFIISSVKWCYQRVFHFRETLAELFSHAKTPQTALRLVSFHGASAVPKHNIPVSIQELQKWLTGFKELPHVTKKETFQRSNTFSDTRP